MQKSIAYLSLQQLSYYYVNVKDIFYVFYLNRHVYSMGEV
jgi:hypothetical protein